MSWHLTLRVSSPGKMLLLWQVQKLSPSKHISPYLILFVFLRERERHIERWRAGSLSKMPVTGDRSTGTNLMTVSYVGSRDPTPWAIACCLPRCSRAESQNYEVDSGIKPRYSSNGDYVHFNHWAKHSRNLTARQSSPPPGKGKV